MALTLFTAGILAYRQFCYHTCVTVLETGPIVGWRTDRQWCVRAGFLRTVEKISRSFGK